MGKEPIEPTLDISRVNRVEVMGFNHKKSVFPDLQRVTLKVQDNGENLRIFVDDRKNVHNLTEAEEPKPCTNCNECLRSNDEGQFIWVPVVRKTISLPHVSRLEGTVSNDRQVIDLNLHCVELHFQDGGRTLKIFANKRSYREELIYPDGLVDG